MNTIINLQYQDQVNSIIDYKNKHSNFNDLLIVQMLKAVNSIDKNLKLKFLLISLKIYIFSDSQSYLIYIYSHSIQKLNISYSIYSYFISNIIHHFISFYSFIIFYILII